MTEYRLMNEGPGILPHRSRKDSIFNLIRAVHALSKSAEHVLSEVDLLARFDPDLATELQETRSESLRFIMSVATGLAGDLEKELKGE